MGKTTTAGPETATDLAQELSGALDAAALHHQVAVADHGALDLTLLSHKIPFSTAIGAADDWLAAYGIRAGVCLSEAYHSQVVITLGTADGVRAVIEFLAEPWARAITLRRELTTALVKAGIPAEASFDPFRGEGAGAGHCGMDKDVRLQLVLSDDSLSSTVRFTALLGADGVSEGLSLHHSACMRALGDRVAWVVSAAVGSPVHTETYTGCRHEQEHTLLHMTQAQARVLTKRIRAATTSSTTRTEAASSDRGEQNGKPR